MYHYRKTRNTYKRYNAKDKTRSVCTLCSELTSRTEFTAESETMFIVPNRVSYDLFEGRKVIDHLLIIPKRHVKSFDDFTDNEMVDMLRLTAKYEKEGYSMYARGWGVVTRSVEHQHTHLIKTDNQVNRALLYIRRPYFLAKL